MLDTAGSAMDPQLATAEPISRVCDTSVKTYLGKGRKCQTEEEEKNPKTNSKRKKEWETEEETPRSEKEEKEMFHGGADISCNLWQTHAGAEKKCERAGAAEEPLCTDHNTHPLHHVEDHVEESAVKEWS